MGRSVKKKTPSKFVTMEMFAEFCRLTGDCVDACDITFDAFETRIKNLEDATVNQHTLSAVMSNNLSNTMASVAAIKKTFEPVVIENTNLTQEMIDNLKKSTVQPVITSTPPNCAHYACVDNGTCKFNPLLTAPKSTTAHTPKQSQWRNAEERCAHTFKAVHDALALMQGIKYNCGTTGFTVRVRCQGQWRDINVQLSGTKHATLAFYRRNGNYERKEFENTSALAAGIVAVVMYYATR